MKSPLLFLLFSGLLIVSCKKSNPKPLSPQTSHYMMHSGSIDGSPILLNTTNVSSKLIKMQQFDGELSKDFRIRTWLKGPNLLNTEPTPEEQLTLDFVFHLPYDSSEYDLTCNCFPTPDASRLANHINDSSFDWNDPSHLKEILVVSWNGQFGSGMFHAVNPQISAQVKGNLIRIYGTVDSLEVIPNRYLKNLSFDYLVPINP